YGGIGIAWSALARRTAAAVLLTYGSVFALCVVTILPGLLPRDGALAAFRSLSPVTAVFNVVDPEPFFFWQMPAWVTATLLNSLAALFLTALAADRLAPSVGS